MDGGYAAILNHHLHTCCTYNDAWLPHGCQLEWCSDSDSSKPPLSIRKWYAESERRTYIIITGLPKTCYMYVKIVRAFPWYLHTHHVCLDAHVTINISVMIQIVGLTWSEGLFFGKIKQCVWGEGRPYIEVKGCQSLEGGQGEGMTILNHHIHTCCTCDDAWGSHGCQLKCSDSDPSEPPLFMSKRFLKGWKKDIHNGTGLPKTCYGEINRKV